MQSNALPGYIPRATEDVVDRDGAEIIEGLNLEIVQIRYSYVRQFGRQQNRRARKQQFGRTTGCCFRGVQWAVFANAACLDASKACGTAFVAFGVSRPMCQSTSSQRLRTNILRKVPACDAASMAFWPVCPLPDRWYRHPVRHSVGWIGRSQVLANNASTHSYRRSRALILKSICYCLHGAR